MGTLTDPCEWTTETNGTIVGSVEIKLVDYPEAGYFTNNEPEQGEIWIKGDSVAAGYYENDKETAEAFKDGWFMTGDVGEWTKEGHLRIIDRKKNLVKTQNGEYIALEKASRHCVLSMSDTDSFLARVYLPVGHRCAKHLCLCRSNKD